MESRPWWTRAARAMAKRPATIPAVCLETGEVEWMELEGEQQLRNIGQPSWDSCGRGTAGRLNVIWDNAAGPPGRGGEE